MSQPYDVPDDLPTGTGVPGTRDESGAASPPMTPRTIGRYTILRLIGEGGMGAVYEADQEQPQRTVALKVIKPGMASPDLLRRFAQESQALARLQHPGIAQIYDAGTADAGYGPQPYFAMELIRGEGLRDYAERHALTARDRLALMVKVCDAVHHAHQRGLIHRDLKPGNILVDDTGQPKILDFGVARVTDSDAQSTLHTDVGQLVGTLSYMSPEQALADPLELDTRSDVYALGVILYELLAGRLPYTISKKLHETLHTIREQDPAKLGTIDRTFSGDVETIVAKALEKDKNRRYSSTAELAADITRYLQDEPIVARRPTTSYQLRKFVRRHRALVGAMAAVFVVLAAGAVISTWQAVRASRAEAAALRDRDRATAAERAATAARDDAVAARGIAVAAETQAKQDRDRAVAEKERADTESATARAVSEFLQKNLFEQVTGGAQRGTTAPDLSVSGALDRAAANVGGTFRGEPLVEAGVREAIATAYVSLSLFDQAATQLDRALALRRRAQGETDPNVLKAEHTLATVYAGQRRFAPAAELLERVVAASARARGSDDVETLRYRFDLATFYLVDGKPDKAEAHAVGAAAGRRRSLGPNHRDTISALIIVSAVHEARKSFAQALRAATQAYEQARRAHGANDVITLNASTVLQRVKLAASTTSPDRAARAEYLESAARTLDGAKATSLPELIRLAGSRATIAVNQGRPQEAEPALIEALEAASRAGQEELELTAILAGVYALQKKYDEAEGVLRRVLDKPAAALKNLSPNVLPFAMRSLGTGYRNDKRFAEAEAWMSKLVPLVRVTLGEANQQTRVDMFFLADNYASQRKYAEAERAFRELLDVQRRVTGPDAITTVVTMSNIGWVRLQQRRHAEAEDTFREAAAILARTAPETWERFNVDSMMGATLAARGKFGEAEPLLISGYSGMGTRRPSTGAAMSSRFTHEQAGDAIVQMYVDWGNPAAQAEWTEKLRAAKKD